MQFWINPAFLKRDNLKTTNAISLKFSGVTPSYYRIHLKLVHQFIYDSFLFTQIFQRPRP